jgi:23S rRNA (uracil1939-C5)-methyltransferase
MAKFSDKIDYIIDHIDPLGQGVFKQDDQVYFIPKTLPGESGTAKVVKSKKGVNFAISTNTTKASDKRIKPECQHFSNCPGCHFLHTDYSSELEFKKISFTKMLTPLQYQGEISIITAPSRLHYRNRIQLHYNKKTKQLGFINGNNNSILAVPNCLVARPNILKTLNALYTKSSWLELAKNQPNEGHVELYEKDGTVLTIWNQNYAHGGFTQVYNEMNTKLQELVSEHFDLKSEDSLVDLFGGDGNLSNNLNCKKIVVDFYTRPSQEQKFISLDLFEENSLDLFLKKTQIDQCDHCLIDPPRKGFPHIDKWINKLTPKNLIYVSCHPQTMIRDLRNLSGYKIKNVFLIDLFPSTFHFEAMIVLQKILD